MGQGGPSAPSTGSGTLSGTLKILPIFVRLIRNFDAVEKNIRAFLRPAFCHGADVACPILQRHEHALREEPCAVGRLPLVVLHKRQLRRVFLPRRQRPSLVRPSLRQRPNPTPRDPPQQPVQKESAVHRVQQPAPRSSFISMATTPISRHKSEKASPDCCSAK